MADYSTLKAAIRAVIRENGNEEITGNVLQGALISMINTLGAGYTFMGVATPSTNPGTPDYNVAYIGAAGTYINFGGLVIQEGNLGILKLNGDEGWNVELMPGSGGGGVDFVTEPDDLMLDGTLLKFANRNYNQEHPNGLGYKILRKDSTFAAQVTDANTIYEIRYDFDLNNGSVTIPARCTLKFNGGGIRNGTIVYNNTEIQGNPIIDCICTGGLRNSVVTPQMYGAKGDGVTDDQAALNNAANFNDCLFIPAGKYIVSEPITMHSGMTLFGVGRESKIVNPTITGYNKVCVFSGGMQVGTNTGSFLNLTAYACTISADRMSVETADTSPFRVGDLIFICKDETYSTKNPPHYWNAKVVGIVENQSLTLDCYVDNDDLVGVDCLVRDLATLPQGGGHYADFLTENICIHDLSLNNSEDQGSGMYVMSIGSYGADIYNIWAHGNTIIGSNYLVNATIRNIVAEFDGGFLDVPEINQNVEVCECRGKRFGNRQNTIGITFLQGYKAFVHDNMFDFGNLGKLGFGSHIKPIIKDNVLLNLYVSSGRPIELSSFGKSIFTGNRVSSSVNTSIVNLSLSTGNIVTGNYIENPNSARWIEAYTTIDFGKNVIKDNFLTNTPISDAYYYSFPNSTISTFIPWVAEPGTKTIAAGATYTAFNLPKLIYNARVVKITIMLSKGNYTIALKKLSTSAPGTTQSFNLVNGTCAEIYIFGNSDYINVKRDGDTAGAYRFNFAAHYTLQEINITNNDPSDSKQLYVMLIEAIVP